MIVKLQKTIELTLATCYLFNQIGKSKNKNGLGKIVLLTSLLCIINSIILTQYSKLTEIITVREIELNLSIIAEYCSKIGETLLISAAFYTNHSVLAKIYGLLRIPTFVYFDSVRGKFDENFTGFIENLVYGIEFIFAGFFIMLNPLFSNKSVKNGMSLLIMYVTYGFTCYLLTLFKLPFEVNKHSMHVISTINSVINTVLYGLMANSLCHSTQKTVCTIKNPNKIAESEEAKMKALIEFNESY